MSVGLLGAMKGLGEGLSDAGKQMAEDAYEAKRQERLEAARARLAEMQHAMTLERDDRSHAMTLERDEIGHGRTLERDELGHERTLERDQIGHGLNLERDRVGHGYTMERDRAGFAHEIGRDRTRHGFDLERDATQHGYRMEQGAAGSAAKGADDSGPGTTELNHVRGMVSTMFGGSLDSMGNMMLPPENREQAIEVYGRAEALARQGMPLGQAVYFAYQAVTGLKNEDSAKAAAEAEAMSQGMTGWTKRAQRNEFVNRRAQEILNESRALEPMFDQMMLRPSGLLSSPGGSTGPGAGEPASQPQRLSPGQMVDGWEYTGGDPNQQSSWRRAQ